MANKITEDPRIDPRIKDQFKDIDFPELMAGSVSREEMLAKVNSEEGQMELMIYEAIFNDPRLDDAISSDGLKNETIEMKQKFFKLLKDRGLVNDDNIQEKDSDDYALLLQLFIGRGEFFFCHWYAIDEQTILDRLSVTSGEKFFITMATPVDGPKIYVDKLATYMKKLK